MPESSTAPPPEKPASERGFWGLVGLQFQGAFSDSLYKYVLMALILLRYDEESVQGRWNAIVGAIFSIPYLIFAGWTGALADRFSKRAIALATKAGEVGIMSLGGVALFFYSRDPSAWAFAATIFVLFLMATQSTFFSPSKYGILPEILTERRLAWGNGIINMTTMVSIILGAVAAGFLTSWLGGRRLEIISILLVGLAVLGLVSGRAIPRVASARPGMRVAINHFPELWSNARIILADRALTLCVLGISYFWFLGIIVLTNAPVWAVHGLGFERKELAVTITAVAAVGIAIGSLLVGALSRRGIELGFVPLGGIGITLFSLPLAFATPELMAWRQWSLNLGGEAPLLVGPMTIVMLGFLMLLGAASGFFTVPLNAFLQQRAPAEERGGVIAAMNFVNFTGMLVASGVYWALIDALGFTSSQIFAIVSIVTFGATAYLLTLLPEALLGLVSIMLTRLIYRIRVVGSGRIPANGPALLVCNHVSFVDALLVLAIAPRPVRFIVWQRLFNRPLLGFFLKIMRAIPISADQRPRALLASLDEAAQSLERGELVCIFAEGHITRTGMMLPFQRGFQHILSRSPAPVIPIHLDGVWGSIFSFEQGKFFWKWPRRIPYRVRIAIGEPMPSDVAPDRLRNRILELGGECAMANKDSTAPVHHRFVRLARRASGRFCIADARLEPKKYGAVSRFALALIRLVPVWRGVGRAAVETPHWTYGRTLTAAVLIARRLKKHWAGQEMVGLYLPPTTGAVAANIAAALAGKTAVNLNYTAGPEIVRHCAQACGLKTTVTSKLFVTRLKQEPPEGALFLEEIMKPPPGLGEKLVAAIAAKVLPVRALERFCGAESNPTPDSIATVIFSSGSTGMPKGIMLSHFNVASNIASFEQAVRLWPTDRLIGFLPFFHSFGYSVSLWGALSIGFGVVHHPNPLEARAIGDLVEKYGVTIAIATPTFLQQYIRRIEPRKFGGLQFVLTGAEKLPARTAEAFRERFGIEVYEGYGTTECAPVVSVNVGDHRARGMHQVGAKRGSVGHPLPGVVVGIVDPDTGEALDSGKPGLIRVRGPNVMVGYLNQPERTAEVLKDGWYSTGDIGYLDEDGFIFITDRLSRFSKLGGEMVPHVKIEEELHRAVGAEEQVFAVTAAPDEAKGEQLVVLHTLEEARLDGLSEKLAAAGLPNLWIPRRAMFFKIESIPALGTGKLDLKRVKETAARLAAGGGASEGEKAEEAS